MKTYLQNGHAGGGLWCRRALSISGCTGKDQHTTLDLSYMWGEELWCEVDYSGVVRDLGFVHTVLL
jgi:hypothetical protein